MTIPASAAAPPSATKPPDFTMDSDADLFVWMADAAADPVTAKAAFAELYRRHAAFIFAQCERRYGNAAEEITAEAFRRVYKSAARFDPSKLRLP